MRFQNNGFSLVELLVTTVVVTVISSAAWFSMGIMFKSDEMSSNRAKAVNLLRLSQEEVRRVAQNNFDDLGKSGCTFQEATGCSFKEIPEDLPEFEDFTRTLQVQNIHSTGELKSVRVTVHWNEFEVPRTLESVVRLSRPPAALPGNISGLITDEDKNPISGVQVRISLKGEVHTTKSFSSLAKRANGTVYNYTFQTAGGQYQVNPGDAWSMKATHSTHQPQEIAPIAVASKQDRVIDFIMDSNPEDATIEGILFNAETPSNLPVFRNSSTFELYDEGKRVQQKGGGNSVVFTVSFDDSQQQCFTFNTHNAYRSGFAGVFSCLGGQIKQDENGWSSAQMRDAQGTLSCSAPWNGNNNTDRVCVNPGDKITHNIPLGDLPMATLQGTVRDLQGQPIANADIFIRWHDNKGHSFTEGAWTTTNGQGFYQVPLPAAQTMYPNTAGRYMRVWARAEVPVVRCCDKNGTVNKDSRESRQVGPIYENTIVTHDMSIDTSEIDQKCGDATGRIRDDKKNVFLQSAEVRLSNGTEHTNGVGTYQFACSDSGFRINQGNHHVQVKGSAFYDYDSAGNSIYAPRSRVAIQANTTNQIPVIDVWPVGKGNFKLEVVDAATSKPVKGAKVQINGPGPDKSGNTNSDGILTWSGAQESWPPQDPGFPGGPYYKTDSREYSISVSHSDVYNNFSQSNIKLNDGESKTIRVELQPRGSM